MHKNPLWPLCGTCRDQNHEVAVGCLMLVLLPYIECVNTVLLCTESLRDQQLTWLSKLWPGIAETRPVGMDAMGAGCGRVSADAGTGIWAVGALTVEWAARTTLGPAGGIIRAMSVSARQRCRGPHEANGSRCPGGKQNGPKPAHGAAACKDWQPS